MSATIEKVLIIEDDEIQREILKTYFTNLGYSLKESGSAKEGMDIANDWIPDIIFLDVYLPDGNGLDLVEEMRSQKSLDKTVIIMMSADTSEDTSLIGLLKEADEFLHKPIRTAEVAIKLRRLLDQRHYREAIDQLNTNLLAEKEVLAHYFSDDVISKITENKDSSKLSGENLTATILFFDIRNFTSISEKLKPNLVAELINLIFTDVMDLILSHDGSVNKLIGDAILATFGCPYNSEKDAINAIKCALAISKVIAFFNKVKPAYLEKDLKIGIGITTGEVFAGNIGSFRRMEYTVIGDVVNTASRLQSLTKKANVDILIDGNTRRAAEGLIKTRRVRVKGIRGKTEEVEIYTLDGLVEKEAASEESDDMTFF